MEDRVHHFCRSESSVPFPFVHVYNLQMLFTGGGITNKLNWSICHFCLVDLLYLYMHDASHQIQVPYYLKAVSPMHLQTPNLWLNAIVYIVMFMDN